MNKAKTIALVLAIAAAAAFAFLLLPANRSGKHELIRIHIRADSNSAADQDVKYAVRDSVTDYLLPFLADCDTRADAYKVLSFRISDIQKTADRVLLAAGFKYQSTVTLINEYFPARMYGDFTVESGYYDALLIELGSGGGDNWWCVVYPPLCLVNGGGNIKYKSKLQEIIENWSKNR